MALDSYGEAMRYCAFVSCRTFLLALETFEALDW